MNKPLYSITLEKISNELQFEQIYLPLPADKIKIVNREVNRPGLALAGFFTVFEPSRIQVIGRAELQYLYEIGKGVADARLDAFFAQRPVAVVITTNFDIGDEILTPAKKYGVPIDDIKSKKKTNSIAGARHVAIYIIRKLTDLSLKEIAKVFGRDHSTLVSSINKVELNIKTVKNYESEINLLIKEIRGV